MQKEVLILDSNIWISYLVSRRLDTLVTIIHDHQLTVLTSTPLIKEIQEVLSRPKFKKYLKHSDIKEFIAIHLKLCQFKDTDETVHHITDPKDNFLLNLYNKGKATLLVSGDKKFLLEANELKYRIMTLREFEASFSL
jgi:putative PIN family toxin of toxin-antitoxin system